MGLEEAKICAPISSVWRCPGDNDLWTVVGYDENWHRVRLRSLGTGRFAYSPLLWKGKVKTVEGSMIATKWEFVSSPCPKCDGPLSDQRDYICEKCRFGN